MTSPRARFTGTVDQLHGVIAPFCTHVAWLLYQEKPKDPVKPDLLIAQKLLLKALTAISPNLSFTKSQLEAVFERLQGEKGFEELLDEDMRAEWVETNRRRLYMCCRHLSQARLRNPQPKWLALVDDRWGPQSQSSSFQDTAADTLADTPADDLDLSAESGEKADAAAAASGAAGGEDAQLPETEAT